MRDGLDYKAIREAISRADPSVVHTIKQYVSKLEEELAAERYLSEQRRVWINQNKGVYTPIELYDK